MLIDQAVVVELDAVGFVCRMCNNDARQEVGFGAIADERPCIDAIAHFEFCTWLALLGDALLLAKDAVACRGSHDVEAHARPKPQKEFRWSLARGSLRCVAVHCQYLLMVSDKGTCGSVFL